MKVTNQDLTGLGAVGSGRTQEAQRSSSTGASSSSASAGGGDRVDFSSALGSVSRALAKFDADRGAKVQALAAQYQAGTLTTDSAAISRGLVSEALSQ
jgi:hypothetical protein